MPHPPPRRIRPTSVIQGFCADAHGLAMKCCWWVLLCTHLFEPWCWCFAVVVHSLHTNIKYMLGGVVVRIYLVFMIFCTCLQFALIDIFMLHPFPLRTHPPTVIQGFCADAHSLPMKCCWWVVLYAFIWCWWFFALVVYFGVQFTVDDTWYLVYSCYTHPPCAHTHPPSIQDFMRWRVWLNKEMLLVGGVVARTQ